MMYKFRPEWGEYVQYVDPGTGYMYVGTVTSKVYHDLWCVVDFVRPPVGFLAKMRRHVVLLENLRPIA
jgi:hypothetical protein